MKKLINGSNCVNGISNHDIGYIPVDELDVINQTYTIDVVRGMYDISCNGRPFMVM